MLLYIIRHGDPIYGPVEQLTVRGHKQARALTERLKKAGLTHIYCSPLRRARETAEPTANALGLPITILPWTSEDVAISYFAKTFADGHFDWCWKRDDIYVHMKGENYSMGENWADHELFADMPKAKSGYADMVKQSDSLFAKHGYIREDHVYRIERPNEDRIAVFCHQGFTITWLSHILQIPPNLFWHAFDVSHASVTVVNFQNRACGYTVPCLWTLSDMSHIFADDQTDFTYQSYIPF